MPVTHKEGDRYPLRPPSLLREVQVEPNGLISHVEGGALPSPATSFRILSAIKKLFIWKKEKRILLFLYMLDINTCLSYN
jgi:hypothetical protein